MSSGPEVRRSALAPLQHRNFRWYFFADAVNLAGSAMSSVALAFAVLSVSSSATALGAVLAANTVPLILFLLFGGVIADRLPRVLIVRVGNVAAALTQGTAAYLVITGQAHLWMLIVLEALNGVVLAVLFPALQGMFPQLVPHGMLQEANLLQSMARGALRVVGPTLSAWLVVTVGAGWALAFDALTWLASAVLLAWVSIPPPSRETSHSMLSELREGWSVFRGTTWLWGVVVVFSILNAIHIGAWSTLGPPRAKETFGAQGWGLVLSAESIGLLVTTVVLLRRRLARPLRTGMVGIAAVGPALFMLGAYPHLWAVAVAAFVAGAGIEVFSLGWQLAMQENVEERMLSRAYSYDALGSFVAMPIGQLAYGPLALHFGYTGVLVVSGIAYSLLALLTLGSRSIRSLGRTG